MARAAKNSGKRSGGKKRNARKPRSQKPTGQPPIDGGKALVVVPGAPAKMEAGPEQEQQRKTGRPTTFTQEIADEICDQLADGKTLTAICKLDHMPARSTVYKWLDEHKAFSDAYARARERQAMTWADEMADIADDSSFDFVMGEHGPQLDREHVARSRLRFDTRRFLVAKYAPRLFGDKVQVEASGPNGAPIQTQQTTKLDVGNLSADQLAALASIRLSAD